MHRHHLPDFPGNQATRRSTLVTYLENPLGGVGPSGMIDISKKYTRLGL